MADAGEVYDISIEMMQSAKGIALLEESAKADAAEQHATKDFRLLVFECPRDTSCPRFPDQARHGHLFWRGMRDD